MPDSEELREALGADKPTREQMLGDVVDEIAEKVHAVLQGNAGNKLSNELCIGIHGVLKHEVSKIIFANQSLLEGATHDEI